MEENNNEDENYDTESLVLSEPEENLDLEEEEEEDIEDDNNSKHNFGEEEEDEPYELNDLDDLENDDDFGDNEENEELTFGGAKKQNENTIFKNSILDVTENNSDYYNVTNDSEDEEDEEDENYLEKFDNNLKANYITDYHPECIIQNYEEVLALSNVVRDSNGIIIDDLHKTLPYLTKYEKTKIIGVRANQINNGSKPYIDIPNNIIDGYIIAIQELKEKKIPFIIRRPLVGGKVEFWKLNDLEDVSL